VTPQMLRISVDLTLPADAVTQIFAILAKRGVGEAYTALALVEQLLGPEPRASSQIPAASAVKARVVRPGTP